MKALRFITIIVLLCVALGANAKKKREYLPGLVMEASEPSGQHCFIVTGIEASSQPIFPVFNTEYEKMDRKDMLRTERHYRENSHAMFKAATGYELGGGVDAPVTEESRKYDFLETDYH